MHCERAQEFFSDYVEQALDPPMRAALEAHLSGCVPCRTEVESLHATFHALESVPEVEPPWDGAWQVMAQIRRVRAEEYEARRRAPGFLHWLRQLSPASAAMGAGLATLVLAGGLLIPGVSQHVQLAMGRFQPGSPVPAPAPPAAELPRLGIGYGPMTADGRQVTLQFTPAIDLPDARLQVLSSERPFRLEHSSPMSGGRRVDMPLVLAAAQPAQVLRVVLGSPALGKEYRYLVVLPQTVGQPRPVTLVMESQPLEAALRRLAPALDLPVVVTGVEEGSVRLGVQDETPQACLEQLAAQLGARVGREDGVYRFAPLR